MLNSINAALQITIMQECSICIGSLDLKSLFSDMKFDYSLNVIV